MKHMSQYKKWINPALMIIALVCVPSLLFAGPGDPGCPDCPIDGGLSLLLAAGVGYGVKRYKDAKKGKEEEVGS